MNVGMGLGWGSCMALYKQITIISLSLRAEIGRWVDIPFTGLELSMQCLLAAGLISVQHWGDNKNPWQLSSTYWNMNLVPPSSTGSVLVFSSCSA